MKKKLKNKLLKILNGPKYIDNFPKLKMLVK